MSHDFSAFKSHSVQTPAPKLAPLRRKGSRAIRPEELDAALEDATSQDEELQEFGSKTEAESRNKPREIGGPSGPEPTRYGDWEVGGIASDF